MADADDTEARRQWSDSLAAAWERHRTYLFESQRRVSDWLVDRLDPQPGQTILELAAGPGETGFLVADRLGPEGKLISTDLGSGMVDAARRGAEARRLTNVEFRVMDAQQIDLPDASVDGVICRFGLMLIPEPDRAIVEVRRVLRPGGRLAYGVWGPPDRNPWMTLLAMAVMQHGHEPPGDPFGPGGPFSLADQDRNRALLAGAGFTDVRAEEIPATFVFDSFDHYWTVQSEAAGPLALLISSLPADSAHAIRETVEPMLAPFQSGSSYEIPSLAVALSAA